jgi:uncharacterized protein YjgD (DUF1641 family)
LNPVVIDSSVLIDAILYVKTKNLEKIISHHEAFVPVNALEETLFKTKTIVGIVGDSIKKDNIFEIKRLGSKELGGKKLKTDLMWFLNLFRMV